MSQKPASSDQPVEILRLDNQLCFALYGAASGDNLDEIEAIGKVARDNGLPLHMDGARFANALVALDASPADMTWKRGVDILSFGATKNGCWCAEAIIFLKPELATEMPFIRKRSAQLSCRWSIERAEALSPSPGAWVPRLPPRTEISTQLVPDE